MARRAALIAILLAGGAVLFAVQRHKVTTPITPRPALYLVADAEREAERLPLEATRVSDAEEMHVGEQLARFTCPRKQRGTNPDYVGNVGGRVAQQVQRKAISYTFCVNEDRDFVNAYAMPGGFVVIGRGLLALLESEDELAFILGHEIAHVDDRHAIERVQYELASRKLGVEGIYQLGSPLHMLLEAGYTKEQEQEADRDGLAFAVAAGYSPKGGLDVMRRFAKMEEQTRGATSPIEEFANVPLGALQEYFRSHPPAAERLQDLEQVVASRRWNPNEPVRAYDLRPMFLSEQAAALDKQGRWAKSIAVYEEALRQNANYQEALGGMALVKWRSGDAVGAEKAAIAAMLNGARVEDMRIAARAGAIADRQAALDALTVASQPTGRDAYNFARVEIIGLSSLPESAARQKLDDLLSEVNPAPPAVSRFRSEIAWWMDRTGDFASALSELEMAHQLYPNFKPVVMQKAWVESELGRQADAETDLADFPVVAEAGTRDSDITPFALRVMVSWRTDQKNDAKSQFQQLAETDPVWMVHNWVANTFSPPSAAILFQLQAAEAARRAEEDRKKREAGPELGLFRP